MTTKKKERTLISLSSEELRWLRRASKDQGRPIAAIVRTAVSEYRVRADRGSVITATAGLWKSNKLDGNDYVATLRDEWR